MFYAKAKVDEKLALKADVSTLDDYLTTADADNAYLTKTEAGTTYALKSELGEKPASDTEDTLWEEGGGGQECYSRCRWPVIAQGECRCELYPRQRRTEERSF